MNKVSLKLFILLFTLATLPARSETMKSPKIIYNNMHGFVVKKVVLQDSETIVEFTCSDMEGKGLEIPSEAYIIDEEGVAYPLKSSVGICLDSTVVIEDKGRKEFSLIFGPLPKETKSFDIVSGNSHSGMRILGVHKKNYRPWDSDGANEDMTTSGLGQIEYRRDTTYIIGRLKNYSRDWGVELMFSSFHPFLEEDAAFRHDKYPSCDRIADDGTFVLPVVMDAPAWGSFHMTDFMGGEMEFFAYPGDTLYVEVDDYMEPWRKAVFRSAANNDSHGAMVRAGRYVPTLLELAARKDYSYEILSKLVESKRKGQKEAVKYLAWKYGLSEHERKLLSNRTDIDYGLAMLEIVKKYKKGDSQDSYGFIKDMELDDNALAAEAEQYGVFLDFLANSGYKDEQPANGGNNFTAQCMRVKRLRYDIGAHDYETLKKDAGLDIPYLKGKIGFFESITKDTDNGYSYDITEAEGRELMERLTKGHEGKYIAFVYLTADAQGADKVNNKLDNLIADFHGSKDLKFIFVFSEEESDKDKYKDFVRRFLEGETCHLLSKGEGVLLKEAMRISSLSRLNLTIDREGRVMNAPFYINQGETDFRRKLRNMLSEEK